MAQCVIGNNSSLSQKNEASNKSSHDTPSGPDTEQNRTAMGSTDSYVGDMVSAKQDQASA